MKKMLLVLIIFFVLCFPAGATEIPDSGNIERSLPSDISRQLPSLDDYLSIDLNSGLSGILDYAGEQAGGTLRRGMRAALAVVAAALLCSLVWSLYQTSMRTLSGQSGTQIINIVGVLVIFAIISGSVSSITGMATEAISALSTFSKVLLPSIAAAAAASGTPAAASVRQVATLFFSDILLGTIKSVMLPLVYAYIAVRAASVVSENRLLEKTAGLIKGVVSGGLKITLGIFAAYLTLGGAVAAAADSVTLRAARLLLSGGVPFVGSAIADSAGVIAAGATVIKNALSVYGLIAVLYICAAPVLECGVHYLLLRGAAALGGSFSEGGLGGFIDGVADAFGMLFGMTAAAGLLILISVVAGIFAVGSA